MGRQRRREDEHADYAEYERLEHPHRGHLHLMTPESRGCDDTWMEIYPTGAPRIN